MLAFIIDWRRRPIDPVVTHRMANSLGVGTGLTAKAHAIGPHVFAATLGPSKCVAMASGHKLLFTGFIQNRGELLSALGVERCSDAVLYAAAREQYKEATDRRVIGEYAAIIIDPLAALVSLIRAPIQAPPLHCYRSPDQLVVGSTARAIFATGALRAEVDEQKIADSLYLNYSDAERDWFVGLTRLPVGSRALETPERSSVTRYYDLGETLAVRMKSDSDYVEAAWALLAEGTRAALDGRTRPAISLSGGLDSQAVALHAIESRPVGAPLLGLTGVPEPGWGGDMQPGRFGDERGHVAMLAAQYPELRTETIDAAGRSFDYRLTEMFLHAGGAPRNAMNLHWLHDLHERARSEGCDVLLNGAMGNFSFSFDGNGALANLFARGHWLRLAREISLLPRDVSLMRTIFRQAVRPNLPRAMDRRLTEWRSPTGAHGLARWCPLNADYARQMQVVERARDTLSSRSTLECRLAMLHGAAGEAGDITQAMETIHRVPLRDPTAYRPLVEFCLGIPDNQFLSQGVRRRLAKRMLKGKLADSVVNEPRIGEQCADWLGRLQRHRAAMRVEIDQLRDDPAMQRRFDLNRLAAALDDWPKMSPSAPQRQFLQLALPRALATARFVQWVEAANGGPFNDCTTAS